MKITEIYKELDEFLGDNHYLKHKPIEEWGMHDWITLSEVTMGLINKKRLENGE